MLTKDLSRIDWSKPADVVHNLVRGLSPWPVANTTYHNKLLKIYQAKKVDGFKGIPGQVVASDGLFIVCCGTGSAVELVEVQYEGGKRMGGKDFLRGHPVDEEMILQ
jgi:methionyl-tRNA formyltransferase